MNRAAAIARYTVIRMLRNRVLQVVILFAAGMLAASLLFGALGGMAQKRLLLDLGFAAIETFGLVMAVFSGVVLVREEVESRTLALILSRPVRRLEYLAGRYAGLVIGLGILLLTLSLIHAGLLAAKGADLDWRHAAVFGLTWLKLAVISSLALAVSLFATSTESAVTFSLVFWALGHFSQELRFLAEKSPTVLARWGILLVTWITPDLAVFNLRDTWDAVPSPGAASAWLGASVAYAAAYIVAALGAAGFLFARKEL